MKICHTCCNEKEDSSFGFVDKNRTRLKGTCKECLKEYQKRYRRDNIESMLQKEHERYLKRKQLEPEKHEARISQDKQRPSTRYRSYRNSAKYRNLSFDLSYMEFLTFWQKPCSYCQSSILTIGIDRVDNSKGYTLENCVSCCILCNKMKLDLSTNDWLDHLKKIIETYKG